MNIREKFTEKVDKETGEIILISNICDGKLYGVYSIVSNKTVRQNEKLFRRWKNNNKAIYGHEMVQTRRGWFIDGYNVDEKSKNLWFNLTGLNPNFKKRKNV